MRCMQDQYDDSLDLSARQTHLLGGGGALLGYRQLLRRLAAHPAIDSGSQ